MKPVDVMRSQTVICRLEAMIECYRRRSDAKKNIAFRYAEEGYDGSAQFNKGQAFALDYVADELDSVLSSLRLILQPSEGGDQDV